MNSSFKHLAAGVAALAMMATPVAASARPARGASSGPAAKLSIAGARTGSAPTNVSRLRGGNATLINLGIFAAIVAGVLVATTTGGDDDADSN
ncbi:hypothetical protein [uncultured Sphingomonas sp.]|uniref:hypothetical protein n=1 Tax=uncultured Sphingomonas sp. TaxID=158754 RepID=UPI0035CA89F0